MAFLHATPRLSANILPMRSQSKHARDSFRASLCPWLLAIFITGGYAFAQTSLEVGLDLTIPNAKTPWVLEIYQGNRQLVPIHHSTVTVNRHTGANLAGAVYGSVFFKPKITTELDGINSHNQLHSTSPVFYLLCEEDVDPGAPAKDADLPTFVISRVKQMQDKRVVDRLAVNAFTGKGPHTIDQIEVDTKQMKDGWIQITPKAPMAEGEYVILPLPKTSGSYSMMVWDFGINLSAPNEKDAIVATRH